MKRWLLIALGALVAAVSAIAALLRRRPPPPGTGAVEVLRERHRAEQAERRLEREARQREYELAKGRVIVERDRRLEDPAPTWADVENLERDL